MFFQPQQRRISVATIESLMKLSCLFFVYPCHAASLYICVMCHIRHMWKNIQKWQELHECVNLFNEIFNHCPVMPHILPFYLILEIRINFHFSAPYTLNCLNRNLTLLFVSTYVRYVLCVVSQIGDNEFGEIFWTRHTRSITFQTHVFKNT